MATNMNETTKLAVFPLPVFLLPGGKTQLRIFEPRYVRMVKESIDGKGFALAYANKSLYESHSPWAAHVDIIDFETLPDGLLGITIQAKALVKLHNESIQEDGLRIADVEVTPHWPLEQKEGNEDSHLLANQLKKVFDEHPAVARLYPEPQLDQQQWVTARWLELLPISPCQYKNFIPDHSFDQAQRFVKTVLLGEEKSATIL